MADLSDICAHTLGVGPHRPNWSIITAAPVTSQVIGVLGGLVFTGIILLLQQTPDHGDTMRYRYSMRAMNTLIYVFFALMLTSFFFSSIAGEQLCGRAFAEGTLAAALFAIGAGDTFLSICWLFAVHRIGGEQVGWVKAITAVVMFAAWINMALTIYDAVLAVENDQQGPGRMGLYWWGAALILVPALTGGLVAWVRPVRKWVGKREGGLFTTTAVASLAGAILAIVAFSVFAATDVGPASFPLAIRFAIMGGLGLLLALYLANMAVIERAPENNLKATEVQAAADASSLHRSSMTQTPSGGSMFRVTVEFGRRRPPSE